MSTPLLVAPLVLPAVLTLDQVADTCSAWMGWVQQTDHADAWRLDGSRVRQADAAGVALLRSLARTAEAVRVRLVVEGASPALIAACEAAEAGHLLTPPGARPQG